MNIGIRIQNLSKPLKSRHPRLKLLRKIGQPAHGLHERRDIQHKRQDIRRIHAALDKKDASDDEHRNVQHIAQAIQPCLENCHVLIACLLGDSEFTVALLETALLVLFIGKGLRHPHAGQAVLEL